MLNKAGPATELNIKYFFCLFFPGEIRPQLSLLLGELSLRQKTVEDKTGLKLVGRAVYAGKMEVATFADNGVQLQVFTVEQNHRSLCTSTDTWNTGRNKSASKTRAVGSSSDIDSSEIRCLISGDVDAREQAPDCVIFPVVLLWFVCVAISADSL